MMQNRKTEIPLIYTCPGMFITYRAESASYPPMTTYRFVISSDSEKSFMSDIPACKAEMQSGKDFFATLKSVVLPRTSVEMTPFFCHSSFRGRGFYTSQLRGTKQFLNFICPSESTLPNQKCTGAHQKVCTSAHPTSPKNKTCRCSSKHLLIRIFSHLHIKRAHPHIPQKKMCRCSSKHLHIYISAHSHIKA